MQTHNPKQSIEDLLFSFQKKILGAIRTEVKNLNCSLPQMELMRYLHDNERISLSDAARLLGISKPSASVMIDGMEHRGLIRRTVPDSDRRSVILALTAKSKKLVRTIAEKKRKVIRVLLEKMNAKDQASLSHLLAKLIEE